jgi:phosphomannomutase
MKVVVDCGNGVAGASAPALFRALGCEVIELFSEVDGNFPNHHPDPSKPENLQDVMRTLRETDAELGLAFDGDGDRLGIVTKEGQNIYPDRQMILFAQDVLSRVPGGNIIFDVKCSQRLAPAIEAAGGVAHIYKTGHSLIKARMKELDSPLGGEMSGHIFFKERWFGFDDGSYAGARLLEILSRSPDANAVLNALPTSFSTPELNVACAEGEPHAVVEQLVAAGPLRCARQDLHHRRRACRLARWLRSDPRVQHHAGAGAALRGAPHPSLDMAEACRHPAADQLGAGPAAAGPVAGQHQDRGWALAVPRGGQCAAVVACPLIDIHR